MFNSLILDNSLEIKFSNSIILEKNIIEPKATFSVLLGVNIPISRFSDIQIKRL